MQKPLTKFQVVAFAIVAVFATVLVVGFLYLEGAGRPTSTFLIFGTQILGSLAIFGGLGYGQAKQAQTIETIKTNTNGTLSAEREKNAKLTALLLDQHGIVVDTDGTPLGAQSGTPQHRAE